MLYRHFPKIANKDFSILTLSLAGSADIDRARTLLNKAGALGINLIDAGHEPADIAFVARLLADIAVPAASAHDPATSGRAIPAPAFSLLFEFRGNTAGELDAMIAAAASAATDCYLLLHLADETSLTRIQKEGILAMAESARKGHRIGGYGFATPAAPAKATPAAPAAPSLPATPTPLATTATPAAQADVSAAAIITAAVERWGGWDFFRTDYNYLTAAASVDGYSALNRALETAALSELGCIASDPFAGGLLENQSPKVHEAFRNAPVPRSHDEWALRAVWERQEIVTVAWQPANDAALTRQAIYAEAGRPNSLPGKELAVLADAAKLSGYGPNNP